VSRITREEESMEIRPLQTIEEYRACVRFQEETWGAGFSERVPLAILKVSQILGGVTAGAFDDSGELVGFVFGMTGVMGGDTVHWSDMLAVRPDLQDSGLGLRLKAYQRERMLQLGVRTMRWTFDPLESKNAHLNINKLGVTVDRYVVDMYGQTDSPLHQGIGTDRFVPVWDLDSERVKRRLLEGAPGPAEALETGAAEALGSSVVEGLPMPGRVDLGLREERLLVAIPASVQEVKKTSIEAARAWREATRTVLSHYLAAGYEVRELYRHEQQSNYLLVRTESHAGTFEPGERDQ
jgi:predicted GNAT superfamily acetyltransferase